MQRRCAVRAVVARQRCPIAHQHERARCRCRAAAAVQRRSRKTRCPAGMDGWMEAGRPAAIVQQSRLGGRGHMAERANKGADNVNEGITVPITPTQAAAHLRHARAWLRRRARRNDEVRDRRRLMRRVVSHRRATDMPPPSARRRSRLVATPHNVCDAEGSGMVAAVGRVGLRCGWCACFASISSLMATC